MPELPDITIYVEALATRVVGHHVRTIRFFSPFLLRSVNPPVESTYGRRIIGVRRLGKQIVIDLEDDLHLVLHLMVSGRLQWKPVGARSPGKIGLAAFDTDEGTLLFTEASTKKRASLHVVKGESGVSAMHRGGIEVGEVSLDEFAAVLQRENHTLKRSLTDPRLFSGIGNSYSDEILHRARLSPLARSLDVTPDETRRLYESCRVVLTEWTDRLREEAQGAFPAKVTAFRPDMAVHGKFGRPCPQCGTVVQRIVYAENECNYCPRCQTGGRILADRSLSRLLKEDWPKTVDDL